MPTLSSIVSRCWMKQSYPALLGVFCLLNSMPYSGTAHAQEGLQFSSAGEAAAAARRIDFVEEPYNMKLGPIDIRLGAGLDLEYNDNINLAEEGALEDYIIRPIVDIGASWQITQLNRLSLNVGLGYDYYVNYGDEAQADFITVSPQSELAFDFYVGDARITIYDRFSLQQDPTQEIQIADVVAFRRFSNIAGIDVLWDLNDLDLLFGYGFQNYFSVDEDEFDFIDRHSHLFHASASFDFDPTFQAGVGIYGRIDEYDSSFLNDNFTLSSGPFFTWRASPYITLQGNFGFSYGDFSTSNDTTANVTQGLSVGDTSQLHSPYGNLSLSHRVNAYVSHSLVAGYDNPVGLTSNFYHLWYAQHNTQWNIVKDLSIGTRLFVEHAQDSGGVLAERVWLYGGGLTLGYQLTPKLRTNLSWLHTERDSDVFLRDYSQNRVILSLYYQF